MTKRKKSPTDPELDYRAIAQAGDQDPAAEDPATLNGAPLETDPERKRPEKRMVVPVGGEPERAAQEPRKATETKPPARRTLMDYDAQEPRIRTQEARKQPDPDGAGGLTAAPWDWEDALRRVEDLHAGLVGKARMDAILRDYGAEIVRRKIEVMGSPIRVSSDDCPGLKYLQRKAQQVVDRAGFKREEGRDKGMAYSALLNLWIHSLDYEWDGVDGQHHSKGEGIQ